MEEPYPVVLDGSPLHEVSLKVVNYHPTITMPDDQNKLKTVLVLATYGIGAALEGDMLLPLSFPTNSTNGKPREKESHVINRLLTKVINRNLSQPTEHDGANARRGGRTSS